MIFVIRILVVFMIFTTAGYGTEEKTTLKTTDISAGEASTDKTSPDKNTTEKDMTTPPKTANNQSTPENDTSSKDKTNTDKATLEKTVPNQKSASNKTSPVKPPSKKPLPEIGMGKKDAPVVMINYSSLSCGHCAHFYTDILPEIDQKYIKTGLLRIVFRDYPGDQMSLRAHQLAWCKGEIKYLDFMKLLYATQEKWLLASDPIAELKSIALQNDITAKQFEACLKNQEILDQIITMRLEGQKKYNITATPTIIINAKIYQKALTLEELDDIMKPLLASAAEKPKKG